MPVDIARDQLRQTKRFHACVIISEKLIPPSIPSYDVVAVFQFFFAIGNRKV